MTQTAGRLSEIETEAVSAPNSAHPSWRVFVHSLIAAEISVITRRLSKVVALCRGGGGP